jgi:hypothetical protein
MSDRGAVSTTCFAVAAGNVLVALLAASRGDSGWAVGAAVVAVVLVVAGVWARRAES